MTEILTKFLDVLSVISDGGPKAIVTILVIFMLTIIVAAYLVVKFLVRFFEKMTEAREAIVKEKDQVIKERMEKMETVLALYNKSQLDIVDALRKIEMSNHDLSSSISQALNTFFLTHSGNNGNKMQ